MTKQGMKQIFNLTWIGLVVTVGLLLPATAVAASFADSSPHLKASILTGDNGNGYTNLEEVLYQMSRNVGGK
jgi:hypothetical protein